MPSPHSDRLAAIRALLHRRRLDAFLTLCPTHLFYLAGFSGSAGALLVEPRGATLITDGRYTVQAREEVRGARVRITRGSLLAAVAGRLQRRRPRVAFEAALVSVRQKQQLRRAAPEVRWTGVVNWVESLRAVKSAEEIEQMRLAAHLASRVCQQVLPLLKPGVREQEVAAEIEYRMRREGARGPAFETIVASGVRSAYPHARATAKPLKKNELVVLDLGAILGHYCSDLTRTVYLGRAPAKIRRWYRAVLEAQAAAKQALRPGVTTGEVDAAARRVLRGYGLARYFTHSTGHGLGLEVHEEPRLAAGQKTPLRAGNVVTVEPGVYCEGVGGIRIEDDVAILEGGCAELTDAPRELLEL